MPQDQVDIRQARLSDMEGIAQVHMQSWGETYRGLIPETVLATRSVAKSRAIWHEILSVPERERDTDVFVACVPKGVVGFVCAGPQRERRHTERGFGGEISALYLLQEVHGQGLGAVLFRKALCHLQRRGHSAFSLWVLEGNVKALKFYERFGGQPFDRECKVRGDGHLVEVAIGWRNIPAALPS